MVFYLCLGPILKSRVPSWHLLLYRSPSGLMSFVQGKQKLEFLLSPGLVIDLRGKGFDPLVPALNVGSIEASFLEAL